MQLVDYDLEQLCHQLAYQLVAKSADVPHNFVIQGVANSGKTTLCHQLAYQLVKSGVKVVLMDNSRNLARQIRNQFVQMLIDAGETDLALKNIEFHTVQAFAYRILTQTSAEYLLEVGQGDNEFGNDDLQLLDSEPVLLSGPEQDMLVTTAQQLVQELVQESMQRNQNEQFDVDGEIGPMVNVGKSAESDVSQTNLPTMLNSALLNSQNFHTELRELINVFTQYNLTPEEIVQLSNRHEVEIWKYGAAVYTHYLQLVEKLGKYDHNQVVNQAILRLEQLNVADDTVKSQMLQQIDLPNVVIIDNAQELLVNSAKLVEVMSKVGVKVVLVGNPFQVTQDFRGAIGEFATGPRKVNLKLSELITLGNFKNSLPINQIVTSTSQIQGVISQLNVQQFATIEEQYDFIGQTILNQHLEQQYPYSAFAIIGRNNSVLEQAYNYLHQYNLPMDLKLHSTPIRQEKIWKQLVDAINSHRNEWYNQEVDNNANDNANDNVCQVVYQAWESLGLADQLQHDSLMGYNAEYANHVLDTAIQILEQAKQYYFEHLNDNLTKQIEGFIHHINNQGIVGDNIHSVKLDNAVQLLTPTSALGQHFIETFIIEVDDGVWPNLKVRGQVGLAYILRDLLSGKLENLKQWQYSDAMHTVRVGELNLFYTTLTRATSCTHILATSSDETMPSQFIVPDGVTTPPLQDNVEDEPAELEDAIIPKTLADSINKASTLTEIIDLLRIHLLSTAKTSSEIGDLDNEYDNYLKRVLKTLETEQIESANWSNWYYSNYTTATPTFAQIIAEHHNSQLRLSPSTIETLVQCPLRWYFGQRAGKMRSSTKAILGNLVHLTAEKVPELVDDVDYKMEQNQLIVLDTDPTYSQLLQVFDQSIDALDPDDLEFDQLSELEKKQLHSTSQKLLKRIVEYYYMLQNQQLIDAKSEESTQGANLLYKVALDASGAARVEEKVVAKFGQFNCSGVEIEVLLSGKIDRIEVAYQLSNTANASCAGNLGYRAVDWKTGKKIWRPNSEKGILHKENLQLISYQMLLNSINQSPTELDMNSGNQYGKSLGGSLVYLGSTSLSNGIVNQQSIHNLSDVVAELHTYFDQILNSTNFLAVANDNCSYCDMRNSCPVRQEGKMLHNA